jgi:hypothetical protein
VVGSVVKTHVTHEKNTSTETEAIIHTERVGELEPP